MNNGKQYKHIDTISVFFVTVLILSNIVSVKIIKVFFFTFDAGTLLFPLSYIFGDIFTEVYGYKRSRKAIWLGFISSLAMSGLFILVGFLPSAAEWTDQSAYQKILGFTPRIVLASLIAYFAGEFSNSIILATLKVRTNGKYLWLRTIGSTIIGQLVDTGIFIFVAFLGIFSQQMLLTLIISNYFFKVGIEILFTPITYKAVKWLKKEEKEDYFDRETSFNPFKMELK